MADERLEVKSPVIFKGKEFPAGRILVVGRDITEAEKVILLSIGKEVALAGVQIETEGLQVPTKEDLEKTRKYIEDLEKGIVAQEGQINHLEDLLKGRDETIKILEEQLEEANTRRQAALAFEAITDVELAKILKGRNHKAPPLREDMITVLVTSAAPQAPPADPTESPAPQAGPSLSETPEA
jgi:hypothetical protein